MHNNGTGTFSNNGGTFNCQYLNLPRVETGVAIPPTPCYSSIHGNPSFSLPAPNAPTQLLNLPPGYRFKPYDIELILFYLKRKVEGQPLPANCINEVNIYTYNPETLEDQYKPVDGNEMYFFTPRDRKYKNGTRPDRSAAGGYWKASGKDIEIKFGRDVVGKKKTLVFYEGRPPGGAKTSWIMHEYRLNNDPLPSGTGENGMKLDDFVLCRIHDNKRNKKSGEAGENQVNEEEAQIEDTKGHVSYGKMPAARVDNVNMPVGDLTVPGYGNYQTMRMESNFNGYENPLGFFSSNHLPSTVPQAPLSHNPNNDNANNDDIDYSLQMVAPLSSMEYDVVNQYASSTSAYPSTVQYTPSTVQYTPSTMQCTPSNVQKVVAPLSSMEYDVMNQYASTSAYPSTVQYTPSTMQCTPSTVQKVQKVVAPLSSMEYDVANQYASTSAYAVQYTPSTMQCTPSTVQKVHKEEEAFEDMQEEAFEDKERHPFHYLTEHEIHAEGSLYNKEEVFKAQELHCSTEQSDSLVLDAKDGKE